MRYNTSGKAPFGKDWIWFFRSSPFLEPLSLRNNSQTLLALLLTMYVFPALRSWNDERVYGYPRTLHIRANVGHGTAAQPYSDFTAENVRGRIYVVEIGEGNAAPTLIHAYYIVQLTGEGNDRVAITAITFSDMNGDGKPDMFVTLENGSTFVFYNTGTQFSQQNPTK